ncbi:hypothetical protein ABZ725_39720 [Streptomyces sp. NPDC006872]|uniref:hypothetical protein n=1 Tax=Streptomyces sp. NPDC006872 TaxID=3155720 RepID=UPI0033D452B3
MAIVTEAGELKPGLRSYDQRVTACLVDRLRGRAETSGPKTVLLVHNSGLLALLQGLWWLCPMEDSKQKPALDGRL